MAVTYLGRLGTPLITVQQRMKASRASADFGGCLRSIADFCILLKTCHFLLAIAQMTKALSANSSQYIPRSPDAVIWEWFVQLTKRSRTPA